MAVAQAVQTFDGNNSFINGINSVTMCQFAYNAKFGENISTSNVLTCVTDGDDEIKMSSPY
jgi:hypothetical protein